MHLLAIELLHDIFQNCAFSDLATLARVNTTCQIVAETWLYRKIPLFSEEDDLINCLSTIEARPYLALHVRNVAISPHAVFLTPTNFGLLYRVLQITSNMISIVIPPGLSPALFISTRPSLTYLMCPDSIMWSPRFRDWLSSQTNLTGFRIRQGLFRSNSEFPPNVMPLRFPRLRLLSITSSLAPVFIPHNDITILEIDTWLGDTSLRTVYHLLHTSETPSQVISICFYASGGHGDTAQWIGDMALVVSCLPKLLCLELNLFLPGIVVLDEIIPKIPLILTGSPLLLIKITGSIPFVPIAAMSGWHQYSPSLRFAEFAGPITERRVRLFGRWFNSEEDALEDMRKNVHDLAIGVNGAHTEQSLAALLKRSLDLSSSAVEELIWSRESKTLIISLLSHYRGLLPS